MGKVVKAEDVLKHRLNEFGLSKVAYLGSDRDDWPRKIDVVKWVETEPRRVLRIDKDGKGQYVESTSYCYVIGELSWDDHEPCWDFRSIGTRYLRDSTQELNDWLCDFCCRYEVDEDGELCEVERDIEDDF